MLVDYSAFGHFEIYERIVAGRERRGQVVEIAREVYPRIAEASGGRGGVQRQVRFLGSSGWIWQPAGAGSGAASWAKSWRCASRWKTHYRRLTAR